MRILVIVGNKILAPTEKTVFLEYKETLDLAFEQWLRRSYSVVVMNQEFRSDLDVCIITATSCGDDRKGNLISIASAVKKLNKEDAALKSHLDQLRAKMNIKLQYGIRNDRVVSINEITQDERGLKCNCTCPGCGLPLQAKLGEKRQKHFSHNNISCDIAAAQQTALHILAKEIIEEEKQLLLPALSIPKKDVINGLVDYGISVQLPSTMVYRKACIAKCSAVSLEKKVGEIVPDIVTVIQGKRCLVEIAVTHFVDEHKSEKIQEMGLPLFEIDLSELYGGELDRTTIKTAVLYNPDNRKWLYNPLIDEASVWAKEEYQKLILEVENKEAEEEKRRIREQKEKEKKRKTAEEKLRNLFQPLAYKQAIQQLRSDHMTKGVINSCSFVKVCQGEIPFFVDIPITGEMIFQCDRRIWQSRIFDRFIYNRNMTKENAPTIHIKKVQKWLTDYQSGIKIDWSIAHRVYIHFNEYHAKNVSLLYDVIERYLSYLSILGFISQIRYQEATIEKAHSVIPPNTEKAGKLQAILRAIDPCDPDVDYTVEKQLNPISSAYHADDAYTPMEKRDQALRQRTKEEEYQLGLKKVEVMNFSSDDPIMDDIGYRWLVCTECGSIAREDEMAFYGGVGRTNMGTCRFCIGR